MILVIIGVALGLAILEFGFGIIIPDPVDLMFGKDKEK